MTTPGSFAAKGVTVQYFEPKIQGGKYLGVLGNQLSFYGHDKLARGGDWQANITISGRLSEIEEWYESGLGRIIKVIGQDQSVVFKGFSNQVSLNAGSITEVRGPLLDISNRVGARYTPKDNSVNPPIYGTETFTTLVNDSLSQAAYGIFQKAISAGRCTQADAEKERDLQLAEGKEPPRTSTLSISPGSARRATLSIDLLGNIHWLKVYPYVSTTTGDITIRNKIIAILGADPNGIFSTDCTLIGANAFTVPAEAGNGKSAWDVLVDLLNIGHATNDEPMNLYLDDQDRLVYEAIPTTVEYLHAIGDRAQRIRKKSNNMIIYPWEVQPGKWLNVTDFLVSSQQNTTDLKSNPTMKFLEAVKYSLPWGVDLSGGKLDKLSQMVAKITYSGGEF